ncbi:hypothetical protein QSU92_12085 [Microbacterium sp. ET2]|uniref:TetR/AcrR family transcriptional regulator n=1 Tax=Microbacterium albipurpureum TaxID=3050384 RepID=UPI00259D04DA|nr:hypothetical protein [Microbacterium sp. ET2 (Ac-2212)]WJL94703.1 hypothetical protein QSU92_12085 [Microbacterium sp. ET2 (Ac-2212)]
MEAGPHPPAALQPESPAVVRDLSLVPQRGFRRTKAAALYHVGTKAELVEQAYSSVISDFVAFVQARVDDAPGSLERVVAYAEAHIDYMRNHRDHARVIAETLDDAHPTGIDDRPETSRRTDPAVDLIDAARRSGGASASPESSVVVATALHGMIDSAIAAWLDRPEFDLDATKRVMRQFVVCAV